MSSSVFFKFKSQKEPTRVEFDGTGISVFELKRDIILKSGLGDGTDFDLAIYTEDGSEEYDDDTAIVQRSTTVVARRLPPIKPGAGRAARYVSGKMPVTAKNSSRREQASKATSKPASTGATQIQNALTEEDKMAAMFQAQTEQWQAQQEEMAQHTPVFTARSKRPANVPDHDPPNGYICYRCGEKGHWIQLCPTNNDPDFNNRLRIKRTTGIPKAFLKSVDKSVALAQNSDDDAKRPAGLMVNADGDYFVAEPDKKSWEQFQAKAAKSSAAAKAATTEDREAEERGLVCSIDKKIFIDPMKTPCCEKTFCNDCITNALIESDFVCPACQTDGVLIDNLTADEETSQKITDYLKEQAAERASDGAKSPAAAATPQPPAEEVDKAGAEEAKPASEKVESPAAQSNDAKSPPKEDSEQPSNMAESQSTPQADASKAENSNPKKRPAEEPLNNNPKIPKGPKAMQQQMQSQQDMMNGMMNGMGMNGIPPMAGMQGMGPMGMMGFPGMPPMMNPMMMGNMNMPMNPMMMNPMMGMPGFNPMAGGFGAMNNSMFPNFGGDMGGINDGNGSMANNGMGVDHTNSNSNMANNVAKQNSAGNGVPGAPQGPAGVSGGNVVNNNFRQNKHSFTQPNNDDDAYFRKPVNPHRHQNRQRRVRPSDYREL